MTFKVLEGLPELPPLAPASAAVGEPVELAHLRELLTHIDPDAEYPIWRDIVAAIHATNAGTEEDRYALAHDWSAGNLTGTVPARYAGEGPVEQVWETMPPKVGGTSYGTLYYAATAAGYAGPSAAAPPRTTIADDFGKWAKPPPNPGLWPYAAETIQQAVSPMCEIIPGLLEKGIATKLEGVGGSSKSRLALQLGLCIDSGAPVFGRPVERATFVYLSYEDHPDEVARRMKAITAKLQLPAPTARWRDLTNRLQPLAIITESECTVTEFYHEVVDFLRSIPGHKFVVMDSAYDILQFIGAAKINEGSVMAALAVLQKICDDGDATVLYLWHPSQAGQERDGGGGWSVAWFNKPRAIIRIKPLKDNPEVYELDVLKRSNTARPKSGITLHWAEGALLPMTSIEDAESVKVFDDAVIEVALLASEAGTPITQQKNLQKWQLDEIESRCARRPSNREVKEALSKALRTGRLLYQRGHGKVSAGYLPAPPEIETY